MSLLIAIKSPEGIVICSDSRLSVSQPNGTPLPDTAFFDSGTKVWVLSPPNHTVSVGFVGQAASGVRSVGSLLREYGEAVGVRKTVEEIARDLHGKLRPMGLGNIALTVAGFDTTNFYGRMFQINLPGELKELYPQASWGVATGGKDDLARLVIGAIKPTLELMPLGASIDLCKWLIGLTTESQKYSLGVASVGGGPQVAVLEKGRPARLFDPKN